MYLGQLLSGPEALQVYEKGISLLEQEKKKVVSGEVRFVEPGWEII
jgi:hypothetical protein